jgi:dienelactone hydrolase
MKRARGSLFAACVAGAAVIAGPVGAANRPLVLGSGASEVWIFRPAGAVRDVVILAHGWSTPVPTGPFAPWIAHLRSRGSIVIYPRYLSGGGDTTSGALVAFRAGVVAALRYLAPVRVPILALGKSFGGSAVFYYAADARDWKVPGPQAVVSIFPAYPIGAFPIHAVANGVYVRILVGDRDTVAGSGGANAFWAWLAHHPATGKSYVVIRSRPGFVADHDSAQRSNPSSRAVFWRPVDSLLSHLIETSHRGH